MTVYGRTGDVVAINRLATIEDVEKHEGREVDTQDLEALENGSYVIVTQDDGSERLYHQAFLRATNGLAEIGQVIDALVATQDETLKAVVSAPARSPPTHVIDQADQPYGSVRQCCNRCGRMRAPGMLVVDSVAAWSGLPPERRCDRKEVKP